MKELLKFSNLSYRGSETCSIYLTGISKFGTVAFLFAVCADLASIDKIS